MKKVTKEIYYVGYTRILVYWARMMLQLMNFVSEKMLHHYTIHLKSSISGWVKFQFCCNLIHDKGKAAVSEVKYFFFSIFEVLSACYFGAIYFSSYITECLVFLLPCILYREHSKSLG